MTGCHRKGHFAQFQNICHSMTTTKMCRGRKVQRKHIQCSCAHFDNLVLSWSKGNAIDLGQNFFDPMGYDMNSCSSIFMMKKDKSFPPRSYHAESSWWDDLPCKQRRAVVHPCARLPPRHRCGGAIDTALQREVEEHKVSSNDFDGDCFGFLARVLSL